MADDSVVTESKALNRVCDGDRCV
ncbi:hypothetical protein THIOKS12430003 [Thiocapsa sp. KS1]|nr:hypothetical protein THIOKS12430003 [Thiocapsa sp. KS1]